MGIHASGVGSIINRGPNSGCVQKRKTTLELLEMTLKKVKCSQLIIQEVKVCIIGGDSMEEALRKVLKEKKPRLYNKLANNLGTSSGKEISDLLKKQHSENTRRPLTFRGPIISDQ